MSEILSILDAIGQLEDDEIDLADAALQLARRGAPGADIAAAQNHLTDIAREAAKRALAFAPDDLPAAAMMLAGLLVDELDYRGDSETYDDLANANLLRVIERRRGLPVALGILWLHAARAAGVVASGVNFPGHFLIRIGGGNSQLLIDVFAGGSILDADALKSLLRSIYGRATSLREDMLAPMGNRDILLRLVGNIRSRQEQAGEFRNALLTLSDMQKIAPDMAQLLLDAARLHEALDELHAATEALGQFLMLQPDGPSAEHARQQIIRLRGRIN